MIKENEEIILSGNRLIDALKEIEIILISLHKMGSYYGDKLVEDESKVRIEYEKETTKFIDEWGVTQRLAKVRTILSEKFNNTLGEDDMDDLERALEYLKYWTKPGDKPYNE
ncbi:MAG: hypothetical protein N4A50_05150 [Vallitalea sp.]|jgi:hypothetical protein|nr:hypothetical protein [Vallitalea sp.]